jgi:hypothetical protein
MVKNKKKQISAALWKKIKPLLPQSKPSAKIGQGRKASIGRRTGAQRNPLRAAQRHSLGRPAQGTGVRKRHDVLA